MHLGRWGTVAKVVEDLAKVRRPLQWGWSLEQFAAGKRADSRGPGVVNEHSLNAEAVDDAIRSPFFWGTC